MNKELFLTISNVLFMVFSSDAQQIPYPESRIINAMEIDWSTHKRHAIGSDNFLLTWADDNHQYGVWGDGGGFGGTNDSNRVSLGLARIEGPWDNYKGYNRYGHPNSSENTATIIGKSWGILCVEGILYMWVHPDHKLGFGAWADHHKEARLYRSADKGASWQRADWSFTKEDDLLGGNILQYGKNYSDAPDEYTYHYFSHPNILKDAAGNETELQMPGLIYLARVHKNRLMQKEAYEFFAGMQGNKPRWTKEIKQKKPLFLDKNGVGTTIGISYNPGIKRYLLTSEHTQGHRGNLGIFEGPTPWGPWATVTYLTQSKHSEFGHDNAEVVPPNGFFWAFPTKWMEKDGQTLTLTFTGGGMGENNDSFNTVRVRLIKK